MNAMVDASISPLAAAPTGDRFAAPLARLATRLHGRGLIARRSVVNAPATQEAYLVRADLLVAQESPEGAVDIVEPSMDELMERLTALRENIRRARQRYVDGAPDLGRDSARDSVGDGERAQALLERGVAG